MRLLAVALAVLGLVSSMALATPAQRRNAQVRPAQPSDAVAQRCRDISRHVQGKGRDVKAFTYFDECLRRGGRM